MNGRCPIQSVEARFTGGRTRCLWRWVRTVFAAGDDANYIALPGSGRKAVVEDPNRTDWYRFEFRETSPKLVFFQIELMERDQIPVNVTVHRAGERQA